MKYLKTVLILSLSLFSLSAHAYFVSSGDGASEAVIGCEITETDNGLDLSVKIPGISVDEVVKEGAAYQQISVNGCGLSGDAGGPDLPFKGLFVEVPVGLDIRIVEISRETIPVAGNFKVFPRQLPWIESSSEPQPFTIDEAAYQREGWVPLETVRIDDDAMIRGRRVLFLAINPVQYNPVEQSIRVISHLEFRVEYHGESDPQTIQNQQRLESPVFERQASRLLANYESADQTRRAGGSRDGAEYLIITHDDFVSELSSLLEWKILKGYSTRMVTHSEIGGTSSSHIMSYLQNAYDTWDPAPTFVLLVGDVNKLSSVTVSPDAYGNSFPSDHPYSCLDGPDYLPDIFLGRLSVQTTNDCQTVVNKILAYDRNPEIANWYNNALIAAYFQDYDDHNCRADRWFFETGCHVMDYLDLEQNMGIMTAMCTDASGCSTYRFRLDSYPHRPTHPDVVPEEYIALITSASQATSNITTAFNAGVGIVQHRDHGEETGWGDPYFQNSHVNALSNGNRTPVVFSINCLTGAFDYGSDCFAESLQKKSGGGAVGVVAASRVSYSGYNDLLCHGTYTGFFPDYDTSHTGSPYANSYGVAEAMIFGKYYMYLYEGPSEYTEYSFRLFHWFGDPEMMIRTESPQTPGIDLPAAIPDGTNAIVIPITDEDARVALSQEGSLLGVGISESGQVSITLDQPVQGGMDVTVTVSGYNLAPLETLVPSTAPSCGVVQFLAQGYNCDSSVDLRIMDNDLNLNPGVVETVVIHVSSGSDPAGIDLLCTETAPDLGIFDGTFQTYSSGGAGDLMVSHGDTITAFYPDADCEGAPVEVEASVSVDCQDPVISNVAITDVGLNSAIITWTTSEPSYSGLTYGPTSPPDQHVSIEVLTTDHEITLENLDPCTLIFCVIEAEDLHGNITLDDNGGAYYPFTTLMQIILMEANMDVAPGWTEESQWAWGHPTGQGGEYGSPDPTNGFTGGYVCGYNLSGDYPNDMNSTEYLTTSAVNCSIASSVRLSFQCWLGVETNLYDHAQIDVSGNNGSSWQTIWSNGSTSLEGGSWERWEFDISAIAAGQSLVKVRWGMGATDGGWQYCGWNLDDVVIDFITSCSGETPTPMPTYTPTSVPTYTPTSTPTLIPTATPTSTPTSTPPAPTATPTEIPETGMILILDDRELTAGDVFDLRMVLNNPDAGALHCEAYVVLDVFGSYFCWPSWSNIDVKLDCKSYNVDPQSAVNEDILQFTWPSGIGAAGPLYFLGVLCEFDTYNLIGDVQMLEWRYL